MLMELVNRLSKKSKIILLFKLVLIIFLTIYICYFFCQKEKISHYNEGKINLIGTIKDIEYDGRKLTLIIKSKENILVNYYCDEDMDLKLGDRISLSGVLSIPNKNRNFNLFNYKNYLLSKKIFYILKADNIEKVSNNNNFLYLIKQKLIYRLDNINNSSYLKAFILGDSSTIDKEAFNSYRANGISHLFAISGMHVTILSGIILKILNKLNKKTIINEIIVMLFLILYMFIISFSVSIIRATLMFIIPKIFKYFKMKIKPLEVFLIALVITLFINPFYLYSVSFHFSYTVCLYLILFNNLINRYKNYFAKLMMTSFIAFLASIPIQINNFYSINILTVLLNLIFVPIFSLIIFPASLIVFIFPFLINYFNILTNIFEQISLFFSEFSLFTLNLSHIPIYIYIYYYIIITLCLYFTKNKNYYLYFGLLITIIIHYNINYFRCYSYITMIDVGQGDSILISLEHNKGNILIDTGGIIPYNGNTYSITDNTLIPYFKSVSIRKIDYLILTHGDYDHMGESISLVKNFKVGNVIFNSDSYNELENELINELNIKNIKYYKGLESLTINKYKLKFLNTRIYNDENDNSNVIYFNYNDYKFLFMGDAGKEKEKDILEKYNLKDINFLKVGHHGSNTSSSSEFINSINPKYSLISVGKNNRYGHPKKSVLDILSNSKVYRTDLDGSIKIKINKNGYKIRTCSP